MEETMKNRIAVLEDYIMKKCLWQFNSRKWDREKQNDNILLKTTQILCEEPVEMETSADKCYWVEAKALAEVFCSRYPWMNTLEKMEMKDLMQGLKERVDFLTITGSLNQELTDPNY
ncbi:MAG: Fe-only nitrogenase subunit delta [Lachnotalea sp.]